MKDNFWIWMNEYLSLYYKPLLFSLLFRESRTLYLYSPISPSQLFIYRCIKSFPYSMMNVLKSD